MGKELINIIKEHIEWRGQIKSLAWADLKKTYNGAALGWAWAVIRPAVTIFIYWFAFSSGLRGRAGLEGTSFFLWMLPGIIPWFYMRDMLTTGTGGMRRYKHLVTKMKFPVSTIPTFMSLGQFVVHLFMMAAVIVIFIGSGVHPSIYWLQLPLYMILMVLFWTFWGLFGSVLAAMSKDFLNLVKSFSMALFWLSGIMFSITNIHSHAVVIIMKIIPVTFIAEGYRNCFIEMHHGWIWEQPAWLEVYLLEVLIMGLLALWVYKKLKKEMPDVL
ncbi:MAG: ABC transporter permease [Anaerovoracaceae bacterium]|jgi:teichoic acid transport system permease protein